MLAPDAPPPPVPGARTPTLPPPARTPRRLLAAGAIGSILEWYDFTIFGAFAVVLAKVFFAADDPLTGILATFAVFGVGFLARPIGAALFGSLGDRIGRRRTLILAIVLMAVPTTLMAVMPTPERIGVTATFLLVALRFLQGLSAGGEIAGGYTYLGEQAPAGRFARTINWAAWVAFAGVLLGALVAALISAVLDPAQVASFGWRIAFAFNLVLFAAAAIVRRGIDETPEFEALRDDRAVARRPVRDALRAVPGRIASGFLATAWQGVAVYFIVTFVPAYLQVEQEISAPIALVVTAANIAIIIAANFVGARLSDRHGSRQVALVSAAGAALLGAPIWWLVTQEQIAGVIIGLSALSALFGLFYVAQITMVNRSFPARFRYTGHSLAHNLASAAFGGTAALIATWSLIWTGSALAPIVWPIAVAAISTLSCLLYPRHFAGERPEGCATRAGVRSEAG